MSHDERATAGIFGIILVLFFSACTFMATRDHMNEKWQAEAVKHGAATWTVDESGNRVFQWKGETR